MTLDTKALLNACYETALQTMWGRQPGDADAITALANEFSRIAEEHGDFLIERNRDPNIIVRAVRYLATCHAMPPMRDDTAWFSDMLTAMIELACPDTHVFREHEPFFCDIEQGIAVARSNYDRSQ